MDVSSSSDKEDEDFYDCEESLASLKIDDKNEKSSSDSFTSQPCTDGNAEGVAKEHASAEGQQYSEEEGKSSVHEEDTSSAEDNDEHFLTEEEIQSRRKESVEIKNNGNSLYKDQKYEEAVQVYTEGVDLCPKCCTKELSVLHSNRAACYIALDKKTEALEDCNKALEYDPNYLRALQRRAKLHEQTDKLEEALADYKKVLELDPSVKPARQACMELPGRITEKNEKLKEEMMGKLKDLGNMCLKPFGLSTNNFQMQQNEGGSYNIQFVQNPEQR